MATAAALGLAGTTCAPVPPRVPPRPASAAAGAAEVRLEPVRLEAGDAWYLQYTRFKLINASPQAIVPTGWGWGRLERRAAEGGWGPAPRAACATVGIDVDPIAPGASRTVAPLPAIGDEGLPAGHYRFVFGFTRASRPSDRLEAVAAFDVVGLDAAHSAQFLETLGSGETLACLSPAELGALATRFVTVGDPRRVGGLLDVPVRSFDASIAVLDPLGHTQDGCAALARFERERGATRAHAAGVAVMRECTDDGSVKAVAQEWTARALTAEPPVEVLRALALRRDAWPAELAPALAGLVETTPHADVLVEAARALDGELPPDVLARLAPRLVGALRRRAREDLAPEARAALLDAADSIAVRAKLQAPSDAFGEGGLPLRAEDELGSSCSYDPQGNETGCCRVRDATFAMLRLPDGRNLDVVQRGSSVQPAAPPAR